MEYIQQLPIREYKVIVECLTFNHSKFIEQTLEGFVSQQTNFPFVCVIIDDFSNDGEQNVIKDWIICNSKKAPALYQDNNADIYIVEHKNNFNCTLVFYLLKENHKSRRKPKSPYYNAWKNASKYIALCEGDDYWTDPNKLQMQADFLDSHLDYSAVATQSMIIYESGKPSHPFSKHTNDFDWEVGTLIGFRPFHTATMMYRPCEELDNRPRVFSGDMSMVIILSQKGKWKLMSRSTSVYRKHSGGVSSGVQISDLKRDSNAIPYYRKINPKFPERRYKAYLYYTFSVFPPHNSLCNILKYGIKSIWFSLTCYPMSITETLRIAYRIFIKIIKTSRNNQ